MTLTRTIEASQPGAAEQLWQEQQEKRPVESDKDDKTAGIPVIVTMENPRIMPALLVLMGFLCTLIDIPMIIFGGKQLRTIGIICLFGPVLAGVSGLILFVICAGIYNLLTRWRGGFAVEIKNMD
jgi:hypothetical protein